MVAALLSDPGQIQAIRKAVCDTIHIASSSQLGHVVGEAVKNGLWGSIALVTTIPYGFGQVLLVANKLGEPKLSYEMNVAPDDAHPEQSHGIGSAIIRWAVGRHYHLVHLGPFAVSTVVMPNTTLKKLGADPGNAAR